LFCRAFRGHAADPRHQLTDHRDGDCVAGRGAPSTHPLRHERDRFPAGSPEVRPLWRAELSPIDVQQSHLHFIKAARAKRVELKAARRQNAYSAASFLERRSLVRLV
jgi:hypothetical protein